MKIKDLELSQYSYKRISLSLKSGPIFFPPEYEEVFKTLYGEEEIDEEIWFANFDTVYRNIPIPNSIVDYFNEKII